MPVLWLGQVDYRTAWQLQAELASAVAKGACPETLLLLEHPPTITLGRSAKDAHLLASVDRLNTLGIEVVPVDRGGDVTYHGPGQLVGYPIVDLNGRGRDLHAYLRQLEGALIDVLAEYGICAGRKPPHTGVWVEDRKIAAMGIKVSRWISSHGFALNVASDLTGFSHIVPCGLADFEVTSLSRELGQDPDPTLIRNRVAYILMSALGVENGQLQSIDGLSQESQKILSVSVDIEKSLC
jgi:lipoate-protein ligase B